MFGIRKRRPPPFGGVHVDDDKDIQEHRPEEASRNDLWSEARLLLRDLIFALMIAALVVVFIVRPSLRLRHCSRPGESIRVRV